jgi:CRISPR-associated protein Csm5
LIIERDFNNPSFYRYVLRGAPRSGKADARVFSFIKDVHDRPYIPGSSLKGALRTALAWTGWNEVQPGLDRSSLGRNRSWAGQPLERKFFGPDPNHDLLRALQVSDLFGPQKAGEGLLLVNAQVLTKRSAGSPVELEALPGDITFRGTLKIDEDLFSKQAERELGFSNRKHWLDELMARAQAHSLGRIRKLAAWFEEADNASRVAVFYRQLAQASLPENQALLQIGWGAGWDGKTFGSHLQANPQFFERIVEDFRLHRGARGAPPRKPGDPFPRSRRTAMTVRDGKAQAAAPFGWVLVELETK